MQASFAVDAWTTYVTTIHILLFALFRLLSIQWPIVYKRMTVLQIRVSVIKVDVSLWLISIRD